MSAVMTSSLPSGVAVPRSALGPKGWTALMAAVITVVILAPVLNLLVPADSVFHLSDYTLSLIGKIMCYAICALAMDLIYTIGMLVMMVLAIRYRSSMYFEAALLIALFGFVSSMAMAKFLLRGEVIE